MIEGMPAPDEPSDRAFRNGFAATMRIIPEMHGPIIDGMHETFSHQVLSRRKQAPGPEINRLTVHGDSFSEPHREKPTLCTMQSVGRLAQIASLRSSIGASKHIVKIAPHHVDKLIVQGLFLAIVILYRRPETNLQSRSDLIHQFVEQNKIEHLLLGDDEIGVAEAFESIRPERIVMDVPLAAMGPPAMVVGKQRPAPMGE